MPFRYRLQKFLEIRIRKKELQLQEVIKAQNEVNRIELLIAQNKEQIQKTRQDMRKADPMMYDGFDKFLKHLYEIDEKLQEERNIALEKLKIEQEKLVEREKEVNVLDKHKENMKEVYIKEQKALELKELNEIGAQKYYINKKEKDLEEEIEERQLKEAASEKNGK